MHPPPRGRGVRGADVVARWWHRGDGGVPRRRIDIREKRTRIESIVLNVTQRVIRTRNACEDFESGESKRLSMES